MVRFWVRLQKKYFLDDIDAYFLLRAEENALNTPNMSGLLLADGGVNQGTGDEILPLGLEWFLQLVYQYVGYHGS